MGGHVNLSPCVVMGESYAGVLFSAIPTRMYYSNKIPRMKKRNFTETLVSLCRQEPEFFRSGRLNSAAIGRAVGIHQATVHRMLEGQTVEPTPENAQKLCRYFKINREQLVGGAPIPSLDSGASDVFLRLDAAVQRVKLGPVEEAEALLAVAEGLELVRSLGKGK